MFHNTTVLALYANNSIIRNIGSIYWFAIKIVQNTASIGLLIYCYKNTHQIDDDFKILIELHHCLKIIVIAGGILSLLGILLILDVMPHTQIILTFVALCVAIASFLLVNILCYWPIENISHATAPTRKRKQEKKKDRQQQQHRKCEQDQTKKETDKEQIEQHKQNKMYSKPKRANDRTDDKSNHHRIITTTHQSPRSQSQSQSHSQSKSQSKSKTDNIKCNNLKTIYNSKENTPVSDDIDSSNDNNGKQILSVPPTNSQLEIHQTLCSLATHSSQTSQSNVSVAQIPSQSSVNYNSNGMNNIGSNNNSNYNINVLPNTNINSNSTANYYVTPWHLPQMVSGTVSGHIHGVHMGSQTVEFPWHVQLDSHAGANGFSTSVLSSMSSSGASAGRLSAGSYGNRRSSSAVRTGLGRFSGSSNGHHVRFSRTRKVPVASGSATNTTVTFNLPSSDPGKDQDSDQQRQPQHKAEHKPQQTQHRQQRNQSQQHVQQTNTNATHAFTNINVINFDNVKTRSRTSSANDADSHASGYNSSSERETSVSKSRARSWTWSYFAHKHTRYSGEDGAKKLKLINVLQNEQGLEILMRHVAGEFAIECLLSVIEFTQFMKHIASNFTNEIGSCGDINVRKAVKKLIELPANVPVSEILTDSGRDDPILQTALRSITNSSRVSDNDVTIELHSDGDSNKTVDRVVNSNTINATNDSDGNETHGQWLVPNIPTIQTSGQPSLSDADSIVINGLEDEFDNENYNFNDTGSHGEIIDVVCDLAMHNVSSNNSVSNSKSVNLNFDNCKYGINSVNKTFGLKNEINLIFCRYKAYKLYEKYIKIGSSFEINLSDVDRKKFMILMNDKQTWFENKQYDSVQLFLLFSKCNLEMLRLLYSSLNRLKKKPQMFEKLATALEMDD